MGVRDSKNGQTVVRDVLPKMMRGKSFNVTYMPLDLASMRSVNAFADQVKKSVDKIDILVNNAGTMAMRHRLTEDGYETNFAVNYLSHFLLTMQLMNLLKAAPSAKIINVGSLAHLCKYQSWEV